jgi:hypothetical protein
LNHYSIPIPEGLFDKLMVVVPHAGGVQHHSLDGDPWPEPQHDPPVALVPFLVVTVPAAAAHLMEHEKYRRAKHVAVLTQHPPAGRQLPWLETERGLVAVQDGAATGVHRPEEAVPATTETERRQRVRQAPLDVLTDELGQFDGNVEVEAALADL